MSAATSRRRRPALGNGGDRYVEVSESAVEASRGNRQPGGGAKRLAAGATLGEDEAGLGEPAYPVTGERLGQQAGAARRLGPRQCPHRPRQRRSGLGVPAGRPGVDARGEDATLAGERAQGGAGVGTEGVFPVEIGRQAVRRVSEMQLAVVVAAEMLLGATPVGKALALLAGGHGAPRARAARAGW